MGNVSFKTYEAEREKPHSRRPVIYQDISGALISTCSINNNQLKSYNLALLSYHWGSFTVSLRVVRGNQNGWHQGRASSPSENLPPQQKSWMSQTNSWNGQKPAGTEMPFLCM